MRKTVLRIILSVATALVLLGFVVSLIHVWRVVNMSLFWTEVAAGLVLLTFGVIYWGWKPYLTQVTRTSTTISSKDTCLEKIKVVNLSDEILSHLTIHYSQKNDTPDTLIYSTQPKFLSNNE